MFKKVSMLLLLAIVSIYFLPAQDFVVSQFVSLSPKPIIEASLNGKSAFFLLDSGSEITILHIGEAEEFDFHLLNYVPGGITKVVSLGNDTSKLYGAGGVKMSIGDMRVKSLFIAADLSNVIKTIHYKTRYKVSGIIGSDVMKKYGFLLDYHNQRLMIQHSDHDVLLGK